MAENSKDKRNISLFMILLGNYRLKKGFKKEERKESPEKKKEMKEDIIMDGLGIMFWPDGTKFEG